MSELSSKEKMEEIFHRATRNYFEDAEKMAKEVPDLWQVSIDDLLTAATKKIRGGDLIEAVKIVALAGMFACVISALTGTKVIDLNIGELRKWYELGRSMLWPVELNSEALPDDLSDFLSVLFKLKKGD